MSRRASRHRAPAAPANRAAAAKLRRPEAPVLGQHDCKADHQRRRQRPGQELDHAIYRTSDSTGDMGPAACGQTAAMQGSSTTAAQRLRWSASSPRTHRPITTARTNPASTHKPTNTVDTIASTDGQTTNASTVAAIM